MAEPPWNSLASPGPCFAPSIARAAHLLPVPRERGGELQRIRHAASMHSAPAPFKDVARKIPDWKPGTVTLLPALGPWAG